MAVNVHDADSARFAWSLVTAFRAANWSGVCFLHRGGIVDERAAEQAPQLNVTVGTKIRINEAMSQRYLKSVTDFAQALLKGTYESRHNQFAKS